jgi:hypothetical protein
MDPETNQECEKSCEEPRRNQYREFTVTPGITGFKVKIGCSEAYFSSAEQLSTAIVAYLADPHGTERLYMTKDIRLTPCRLEGVNRPRQSEPA